MKPFVVGGGAAQVDKKGGVDDKEEENWIKLH
jgi:hypothetical protein